MRSSSIEKNSESAGHRDQIMKKRTLNWLPSLYFLGLVLGSTMQVFAADGGGIAGSVQTSAGKPILAAITVHDLSTPRVAGRTPFDREFGSRSDGTFHIEGVLPGEYEICVAAPQEAVLDPCIWAESAPKVTVAPGVSVTGVQITVETGTLLHVRVNDSNHLLPQTIAPGGTLSLGVVARSNRYLNLRMLSADETGQDHYLVVPFDEPLTLAIQSSKHVLRDANNMRFAGNAGRISLRIPRGTKPTGLVVNVAEQ